ncbi:MULTISPECIES: hydrogenase small subunit [Aliarcobacter]|jgi:quinone-reactive Ni/Fe-hydrogenase small subunit|uniref:hydrogenase small subunit n=1 Tax=Aliarcobacter TaxID=2321111 RepID=UPI0009CD3722|nr:MULTISPECIES: hydrogenase small subunit [Aliarcobacter]OQA74535.1 MAG: Quinone-reactive Ni/Fe-hydrogenase small chain precursor [Candidatus Dependentiae bacterium ADurb.Bin246]MCT7493259.1 hydrogenase small subunit [Aliarcobacter cryaerophilus]MCT7496700.1 hydrogenase small subunit [Aliarcobacter cryaerophilus]MCT7512658.1 hydrogenase small subunit [Aliarcobacter cryaerophilus]MCT7516157.1 hydrogenase small subunit [Aliarcobacter cryaerophilus]
MNDNIERVREVFTQKSTRVDTNKGDEFYSSLFEKSKARLKSLREQKPLRDIDMMEVIETEGVNRRDFMKWVSATTATLMLPPMFAPLVAEATELMNRVPVIWIELQDCAGNTEALLRSSAPTVDDLLFDVLSLEFHHALMACAGNDAEHQLDDAVEHFKGKYLLFVEGSIPTAMNGNYGTIGPSGETFQEHLARLSKDAAAVVAVGTCATFGGVPAASPNPTGAVGVMDLVKGKPIVNIPACPANPANMVGVVLHYVLTGQVPELDSLLRPKFAFGYRIHDNCERRAHFDAGEFVEEWGDEGAKNNWCLYKVGCKGPMTFNNCSIIRYNDGANWPVGVGRGCIGCSEPDFWDKYAYERPMATARIKAPTGGVEKTVDEFGLGLLTATAVGIGVHAIASVVAGKKSNENEER